MHLNSHSWSIINMILFVSPFSCIYREEVSLGSSEVFLISVLYQIIEDAQLPFDQIHDGKLSTKINFYIPILNKNTNTCSH